MRTELHEAWIAPPTPPPTADDHVAVEACVRDYFEGWYDGDVERMAAALHPALAKRAFAQGVDRTAEIDESPAEVMLAATAAGTGRSRKGDRLDIRIADCGAGIASVVVCANHYVECLHLIDTQDGWRIINALWRWADGHGPRS